MNPDPALHPAHPEAKTTAVAQRPLSRREALGLLGSAVAFSAGCSSDASPAAAAGGGVGAAPVGAGGASVAGGATGATSWARGGTQMLAATYPDPFDASPGTACAITCRETIGPCYASTLARRDISEGYPGLPLRLALLVVDESCTPVPDATIDIWHTSNIGSYSGDDAGLNADGSPGGGLPSGPLPPGFDPGGAAGGSPFPVGPGGVPSFPDGGLSATCTVGDPDATRHRYFRGTQTTDATGRASFDSCYPGWYLGRAIHIHFIVRRAGQEYVIAQLYFPEELTRELCSSHPDYSPRAQPDTTNSTDAFYTGLDHELSVARQADGALLAWKTIVLRSSLDEASCGTDGFAGQPLPGAG